MNLIRSDKSQAYCYTHVDPDGLKPEPDLVRLKVVDDEHVRISFENMNLSWPLMPQC